MRLDPKNVHAPEIGNTWLNSSPLSLRALRGRVVLLDFWDYTCVNCIRTLPYVTEWHRRYRDLGLTVIGIHAPEFYFASVPELVSMAARDFGIEYPIVLDNDYQIWQAFANRYWPSKYLIDGGGYIRYFQHGEGSYGETEEAIQELLREANPALKLPPLMEPVRPMDRPGALQACMRPTPELYLGTSRGRIANAEDRQEGAVGTYHYSRQPQEHSVELEGRWVARKDSISAAPNGAPSRLRVRYAAAEVNLVMAASADCPVAQLSVSQDGRAPHTIQVDRPRMYPLLQQNRFSEGTLDLSTTSEGLELFAFTFVSCL